MDSEISEDEIEEEGEEEEEEEEEVRGAMLRFQQRELKRKQAEKAQKKQKVEEKPTPAPVEAKAKARIGLGSNVSTEEMGKLVGNDEYGEWRCVPGFPEDKVVVSSEGWIKNSKPGISLEHAKPTKGCLNLEQERYQINFVGKLYKVHRLICRAFHGPQPLDKKEVDHLNQISNDNRASNLRWVSPRTNSLNKHPEKKIQNNSVPIFGKRVGSSEWIRYNSSTEAAKILSLSHGNVSAVVRGDAIQTLGYEFKRDIASMETDLMDGEIWVPLWGHESTWQISNMGRVKNKKGRWWSPPRTPQVNDGFEYAKINFNNEKYTGVHIEVFKAFNRREVRPGLVIDHINSNKSDNRLSNLQEITYSQNSKKEYDNGRRKGMSVSNSISIVVWNDDTDDEQHNTRSYRSMKQACDVEHIHVGSLSNAFTYKCSNPVLFNGRYWKKVFSTPAQPQPS